MNENVSPMFEDSERLEALRNSLDLHLHIIDFSVADVLD